MSTLKIERALLSVFNKEGIVGLAEALARREVELLATAGTARVLKDAGIPVSLLSSYTGQEELLGGRVKTLHPKLMGGILARRSVDHEEMARLGILPIDLVVVNLYPFAEAAHRDGGNLEEVLEQIDIGGSALLRAGAKNFKEVVVVSYPEDYGPLLEELESTKGGVSLETRRRLAAKALRITGGYDSLISRYLSEGLEEGEHPESLTLNLKRELILRYGENPQQRGAFYCREGEEGALLSGARKLQGKELSYNNILDAGAALELAASFDEVA
ncbi:MAG: bifunctional phosphoribosylaminoimidazolecarboxamide formyltransferase/IMP cyclohydrolase, partial [Nitrospinota bacterium]